jgi:hypothetical protein
MPALIAEAFEVECGDAHSDLGRRLKLRQASLAALVRTEAVVHGVENRGVARVSRFGRGVIGGSRMALSSGGAGPTALRPQTGVAAFRFDAGQGLGRLSELVCLFPECSEEDALWLKLPKKHL